MLAYFFDGRYKVVGVIPHLAHVGEDVDLPHGVIVAALESFSTKFRESLAILL
jgi:hypothetical protein